MSIRDVFYYGAKPNIHPREQFAESLTDARNKCSTEHFWIINEFCDYKNFDWDFDFEFLPDEDVWAESHNNVWPSQHQKDSGTWLCSKEHSDIIIYRNDVFPVYRKNESSTNWVELDTIDHAKFDFSWHPDPTDPPYIYKWGCKFFPAVLRHVLEYRVPGATQEKYMNTVVELVPQHDLWVEHQAIDKNKFDLSWRPNPLDPPFIYVWGNKYIDGKLKSTLEYHAPNATSKKYMPEHIAVLPESDRWVEVHAVDKSKFDFSWRPDPREPAYIYVFGNELFDAIKMPTLEYHCEGATEYKYMDTPVAKLIANAKLFDHLENSYLEDYAWLPDPDSPPYIYVWGNQWNAPEDKISVQFIVPGATEYKFMTQRAIRKPCMDNWIIPDDVNIDGFDFSWEPSPAAPPYIYEFGTQWQKTGGPKYVVPGATEKQYIDFQKATKLSLTKENWRVPDNIDATSFDFSWHPDDTSPPYIYVFATQWAFTGGPVYTVPGATEIKYVDDQLAIAKTNLTNWVYDSSLIDVESFDFSWHPNVEDRPYIYEFGTQWQKTGGPRYITPGADSSSPIKYIDTRIIKATRLPNKVDGCWNVLYPLKDFDFSWHPDITDEPFIYTFGNNLYTAEECATVEYRVSGATERKYVRDISAVLDTNMHNWEIPSDLDVTKFDFSWVPNPNDPPYIYEFGTQHQKTGGPRYITPDATEIKYLDFQKSVAVSNKNNWNIPPNVDTNNFDFSWHPDNTDPAYIYQFGTQWALSGGPSYIVPGATEIKYMDEQTAVALPNRDNWVYDPSLIDIESFDFSWHPYVEDRPYIYEFGTQHQKTGGPRYITPGANSSSPIKYIDTRILKAIRLPNENDQCWVKHYAIKDFDFSWHPDTTEESFVYTFGNNLYSAENCTTIEYKVDGATTRKYITDIVATLDVTMNNWEVPPELDTTKFDFSWVPNPNDPPYIYEFGTQHQKTGGPRYCTPNATEIKYLDFQKAIALSNKNNWNIPSNVDIEDFDFSWHPDNTDPAYIYQFGTQWALSGGPSYIVPGATEIKYMDVSVARALPDMTNWVYDPSLIDVESFDFSWHPYVEDQPYIYEFGTQHQKTGGPRYITPGADSSSPIKYIDTRIIKAHRLPDKLNPCWNVIHNVVDFDWSWHPDDTDDPYIYVFGNQWYPAEVMPTIKYGVPGATLKKYVHSAVATLAPNMDNWVIPDNLDTSSFDFSWIPEPESPPYIYEFATQWQKTGGPKYVVPDATEKKYVDYQKAISLPQAKNWTVPDNIDRSAFDFSWHPDDTSPPYIYVFATQWAFSGGPVYTVPEASEIKYIDDQTAKSLPNRNNWIYDSTEIDVTSFDFSWHPNIEDQPYIYQFGTQWQKTGGPRYITPGADSSSPIKYIDTRIIKATKLPNRASFSILGGAKVRDFDWSWHPDDSSPPYIYRFGNNWYPAEEMPTIEYKVEGATEIKFVTEVIAQLAPNMENWNIPTDVDIATFDFSWIPHPGAPPYTYQFGTKVDNNAGPRYSTPKSSGELVYLPWVEISEDDQLTSEISIARYYINTTLEDLVKEHPNEIFWALQKNIDYTTFDFDWRPGLIEVAWELNYIHVFGSPDSESTQTYFVSANHFLAGNRDLKFVEEFVLTEETLSELFIKPDVFFVDKGNIESAARLELLKAKFGTKIQKTRYLNSWVDTINRCSNRASSQLFWVLNSELDYSDFDFNYYPNPWQMKMVHVFGTQWSHWGTTFLVNRETFSEDTKYIKIIEHLSNLNFVKTIRAKATACVHDVVMIDHSNSELLKISDQVEQKATRKLLATIQYDESYLNTLKTFIKKLPDRKEHYLWVCSSVCDYSTFDFSYVCDPFAKDNLHVFPSGKQKFGDTFLLDVNKTKEIINDIESLELYTTVNYNRTLTADRLPAPQIVTTDDTLVDTVKTSLSHSFPYSIIMTEDNMNLPDNDYEPMNLWEPKTKNIISTSTGNSRLVVPKEASDYVTKELYEYPYIKRAAKLTRSNPLDIVFLSNGEKGADENYEHLLEVTRNLPNRVVRVDGINGRVAAYHAAAEASNTAWMFTVFAKLKVSNKFDWNWQPDRMQVPKHYIFHAKNPVNGLTYGHQAIIAYNKKLTLANQGNGLDFTLDDEHEVVPLISGTAHYNTDEFSTWRTAFREVIKLKADTTDIARDRLDAWLNNANGDFSQYSIKGALDADEYYTEVGGDFSAIKLSYEWDWLLKKFSEV
jgi:hypothetical protein